MGYLYAMEVSSLTLIQEKVVLVPLVMPQISSLAGTGPPDTSKVFSLSFGTVTGLTPPVANLTQVPYAVGLAMGYGDEERCCCKFPHSIALSPQALSVVSPAFTLLGRCWVR